MREDRTNHAPAVSLRLEVAASLARIAGADEPLRDDVRRLLAQSVDALMETLGVPGACVPEVVILSAPPPGDQLLRVYVNGHLCRFPDELLFRAHSYLSGQHLGVRTDSGALQAILSAPPPDGGAKPDGDYLVEFLTLACTEIVKQHASALLGPEQASAYRKLLPADAGEATLPAGAWPPPSEWLRPVLGKALKLRISLADKQSVAEVLRESLLQGRLPADAAEFLVARLRPATLEVQLPPALLRQITTADADGDRRAAATPADERSYFALMRDGLFYELGLHLPHFRLVPNPSLKPNSFTFKINHLTTMPRLGLPADQCLVNDSPDRLGLIGIEGKAVPNPANQYEASVISVGARTRAEQAGLMTWSQLGYLILGFSAELREHGWRLVDHELVRSQLSRLGAEASALVEAVGAQVSVEQLTRVLRRIVAENVSIRDLKLILERLLDYDYIVVDAARYIIFDERMPARDEPDAGWLGDPVNLASFVRAGMKRYLSHKYARGQNTLIVYLLDSEIEHLIAELNAAEGVRSSDSTEHERDRIMRAVRTELDGLPPLNTAPAILTGIEVRPYVQELLALEFPQLAVLAYQELSPELNIQPVARIVLSA